MLSVRLMNIMNKNCPKCKSPDISYNINTNVWYCNNCNAIWYEYYQESGGNIPKGKPDASPNNKIPLLSSLDNTSRDES